MPKVCLYFQVHQPWRIKKYRFFDIGIDENYFEGNDEKTANLQILEKVSKKCYLPTNQLLLQLLKENPDFKVSFSFSGVLLEQLEQFLPQVLESFQALLKKGRVEILSETYHHSLSFLHSPSEFRRQIQLHKNKIKKLFNFSPTVFRNTELIFNNYIAYEAEGLKFKGILAEGADKILGWRSPNFLYQVKGCQNIKVLLKNYRLSDDIAFRFSDKNWSEYPLDAQKYASWINQINGNGEIVNLFMDYETFGEHQWVDTGIFEFLKHLPYELGKYPDNTFVTPSEAIEQLQPIGEVDVTDFVSWADIERDLSAWYSNPMQQEAMKKLFDLEKDILSLGDKNLIDKWRRLTTSDHYYYMCTKWFADGDVHKYFNPYESPYEAFIYFMNVYTDLKLRVENQQKAKQIQNHNYNLELSRKRSY